MALSSRWALTAIWTAAGLLSASQVLAHNSYQLQEPKPNWLTPVEIRKMDGGVDLVERDLEWQIRRVSVSFHSDPAEFSSFGVNVRAITRGSDQSIHLGPLINIKNLIDAFAHEITHVIVMQKYHESIPAWLSEGLANFMGARAAKRFGGSAQDVSFDRLQEWIDQNPSFNIESLSHPLKSRTGGALVPKEVRMRYEASTALMQMLAKKCDIFDLIHLAVGKQLETYLKNTCGIGGESKNSDVMSELNDTFKSWLKKQKAQPPR